MPVVIEKDLEDGTVGNAPPSPWVVRNAAGGGAVTIENDPIDSGRGKVLRLTDTDAADYSEAKLPFGTAKTAFVAVLELLVPETSKNVYVGFYVGATRYDVVRFETSFVKYKNSGGTWTDFPTPFAYSQNRWYRFRLVVNKAATSAELVQVTIDEADQLTSAVNLADFAGDIDAIYVATDSGQNPVTAYANDVQILDRTATISGTVTVYASPTPTPLQDATVYLMRQSSAALFEAVATDSNGDYTFTPIDAGIYVVVSAYDPAVATRGGNAREWIWAR